MSNRKMCRVPAWLSVCLLLLFGALAQAKKTSSGETRARAIYQTGRELYKHGNYAQALKQFAAGHELSHRPKFLVNMAQCQRKLGELDEARKLLERFLAEAPPAAPERRVVSKMLVEI